MLVYDNIMRFNLVGPNVQTKVSAGAFEEADQIGLFVTDYVNETTPMPLQISGNRANNSLVTFDGSVWTPEQTIYWGNGKSDVYAYYPYFENVTDVNSQYFELATDQSGDGYEMSDFLWAKAEGVRQTDGTVNLDMKHLMSKLTVKIVAGEDYIGSLPEDATVHLHSTVTNVNIDLENGAVVKDPYSGAKSIKMKNLGIRTFGGEKAVVYEAIVVPQMLENSVPLLEINSKSVSYLLEDPFNFRPGVAYTYTATLNTSTNAIKVEIGCEIEDWNNAGGDSGNEGDSGEDSGEDDDAIVYSDLSTVETANCYLVQQSGDYMFKAVIGNTDATVGNVKTVEVLWESFGTNEMPNVGDLIASVSYKNGYIRFSTPENFRDGNAVIAAKNSNGTILWSWHIWCAEEGFEGQVYYHDAGTMMDRNLGATSATPGAVGALGLMYQWGRKDPFLGSSSISSSMLAVTTGTWDIATASNCTDDFPEHKLIAEANPTTFYTGINMPNGSWSSTKTPNDPCPAGWKVPEGGINGVWAKALGTSNSVSSSFDYTNNGINFTGIFGEADVIWYPGSGDLDVFDGHLSIGGGLYWSCSTEDFPEGSTEDYYYYGSPYSMRFSSSAVSPSNTQYRGYGLPVRCFKEELVETEPDFEKDEEVKSVPETWKIYYTATAKIEPGKTAVFGANIESNEWDEATGEGVITFDGEVTVIGEDAFFGRSSLTSVTIPEGVTSIGELAFNNCSSLESVTIPNSVTSIGTCAFARCSSLTSVTIPEDVTFIDELAFHNCSNLKEFNGKYASKDGRCLIVNGVLNSFARAGLTKYTIPDSVIKIGSGVFYLCSSLTSVTIPEGVTSIGENAFYGCSSLTSVTISEGVTAIGGYAFYGCSSLTSVTIPEGVTSIGEFVFNNCSSLESVTIPKSVTSIGADAFVDCNSLARVYCKAVTPPQLSGTPFIFTQTLTIYVPAGSVSAYNGAPGWGYWCVGYDFE